MTAPKFLAFDVEIARPFADDGTWRGHNVGIACAATCDETGKVLTWYGEPEDPDEFDTRYTDTITESRAWGIAVHLVNEQAQGRTIVTWNGLGFDLPLLLECMGGGSENPSDYKWLRAMDSLARGHCDMGFLMVAQKGYMIGLETCAKALRVGAKTEGMSGKLAPFLWSGWPEDYEPTDEQAEGVKATGCTPGTYQAQRLVLDYMIQDVKITAAIYEAMLKGKSVRWITQSGKPARYPWKPRRSRKTGQPMTVNEAMALKVPDTSWMTEPRPRSEYTGWLEDLAQKTP